jgi:hypothetical protein
MNNKLHGQSFAECCPAFNSNTRYIFSFETKPLTLVSESAQYGGDIKLTFKPTGSSSNMSLSGKTTDKFTRLYTISNEGSSIDTIAISYASAHAWLIDLDTVYLYEYEGDDNPIYEPYVGRKPSPNPDYPQDIINAGDNGLEVVVKGNNMFDIDTFLNTSWSNGTGKSALEKIENGFHMKNIPNFENRNQINYGFKPLMQYTFRFKVQAVSLLSGKMTFNVTFKYAGIDKPVSTKVTITELDTIYDYLFTSAEGQTVEYLCFGGTQYHFTVYITEPMLVEGAYTKDTMPSFESYFEPTTLSIPATVDNARLWFSEKDRLIKGLNSVEYIQYSPNEWDTTKPYAEQWLKSPIKHDITKTEIGQQLLALATSKGTNILEITGATSLEASYWQQIRPQ